MPTFSFHSTLFTTPTPFPFLRQPKPSLILPRPSLFTASSSSRWWAKEDSPSPSPVPVHQDEDLSTGKEDSSESTETEDECRKRSWTERGWAPWEEAFSVEAEFARRSLDEGEEVPLTSPEAVEAFKMLTPSYRKKRIAEIGEEEYMRRLFAVRGEVPEKLRTIWAGPMALQLVPPRDWPPRGWEVDKEELEFIREAHRLQSVRVDVGGGGENWITAPGFVEKMMDALKEGQETLDAVFGENKELEAKYREWFRANPDRLKMDDVWHLMKNDMLKQYREWVGSNRGEGSEEGDGGGAGDLDRAVKRYEEFMEQYKEKAANEVSEDVKREATDTVNEMAFERYKVFVKQYTEWVDANRDKLEEESYKVIVE